MAYDPMEEVAEGAFDGTQANEVLNYLKEHPGSTAKVLARERVAGLMFSDSAKMLLEALHSDGEVDWEPSPIGRRYFVR